MRRLFAWVSLVGMSVLMMAGGVFAEGQIPPAQISYLTGQVEWQRVGTRNWQAAQINQQLSTGDRVRTGKDGQATLAFNEVGTVDLQPSSEFSIQTLKQDAAAKKFEYVFGLPKGKLRAKVNPIAAGSSLQFETPQATVEVPQEGQDPTLNIGVNADGSINIQSEDGHVWVVRQGDPAVKLTLGPGEQVQVQFNQGTGELRLLDLGGTFNVIGPNGAPVTLNPGDSIVFQGGAATFIPLDPGTDAGTADTLGEPVSGG